MFREFNNKICLFISRGNDNTSFCKSLVIFSTVETTICRNPRKCVEYEITFSIEIMIYGLRSLGIHLLTIVNSRINYTLSLFDSSFYRH